MSTAAGRIAALWHRLAESAKQEAHLASEREALFRELAVAYTGGAAVEKERQFTIRQPHCPDPNRPVSDIARKRAEQALARHGLLHKDP